ncbi:MAG: hypothetical protein ACRD6W_10690 [Nitrososphaerales archaeon]
MSDEFRSGVGGIVLVGATSAATPRATLTQIGRQTDGGARAAEELTLQLDMPLVANRRTPIAGMAGKDTA